MKKRNSLRRGFTLIELALSLGMAALIFGAIFAASVGVWSTSKLDISTSEVWEISRNMRDVYTNIPATTDPAYQDLVDKVKIFPQAMVKDVGGTNTPTNTWGGKVELETDFSVHPKTFTIKYRNVPQRECVKFLLLVPPTGQDGSPTDSFFLSTSGTLSVSLIGKGPGDIADLITTGNTGCSGVVFEYNL